MIILSTDERELQILLDKITQYANSHQYSLHPEKSHVIPFNCPSKSQVEALNETRPWHINAQPIPVNHISTHLGIDRTSMSANATVDARILTARGTLYALMGAGLHGMNGLPIATSTHLYMVYVLPRLLYGLETISIDRPRLKSLEIFHRTTLRCIIGLPERSAIAALHIITGQPTVEAHIHMRLLTLLHSMLCSPGPAQEIILRQYAIKDRTNSWVKIAKDILYEYDLPCIADIFLESPTKAEWKRSVKTAVLEKITTSMEKEANSKSTLKYLHKEFKPFNAHHTVINVNSTRDVTRAATKLRLLTGTYLLQDKLFKLGKSATAICRLCHKEEEDTVHFIVTCQFLEATRSKYMPAILNILSPLNKEPSSISPVSREVITHLLLDHKHPIFTSHFNIRSQDANVIEDITQKLIYALHLRRAEALKSLSVKKNA